MENEHGSRGRVRRRTAVASLFLLGLAAGPAAARDSHCDGARRSERTTGDINPTNVAVVETDLCTRAESSGTLAPEVQMHAIEANAYATGAGVTVAVLDGGFNLDHPDLAGRVRLDRWDAVENDRDPNDLGNGIDDDRDGIVDRAVGHGTFVAGMVLRIAPDAMILPVRVRDDEGHGSNVWVAQGISYAISRKVKVINLSLEVTDFMDDTVRAKLASAARAGISVVVSAGNDGEEDLTELADISGGIAAGAVDSSDRVADFSNCDDDAPDAPGAPRLLFAPGVDLFGPIGSPTRDARGVWSGTSFSAGLVSGAVAVLREERPWLSPSGIADQLIRTADPVFDADGAVLDGTGRVNLLRAVTR